MSWYSPAIFQIHQKAGKHSNLKYHLRRCSSNINRNFSQNFAIHELEPNVQCLKTFRD